MIRAVPYKPCRPRGGDGHWRLTHVKEIERALDRLREEGTMNRARVLFLALLLAGPAAAHEWYPIECCSGMDCRPHPCDDLEDIGGGSVRDIASGSIYRRDQVRPSPNGQCHVCTAGGLTRGAPICAFVVHGT
jgi:hypothetical protein